VVAPKADTQQCDEKSGQSCDQHSRQRSDDKPGKCTEYTACHQSTGQPAQHPSKYSSQYQRDHKHGGPCLPDIALAVSAT